MQPNAVGRIVSVQVGQPREVQHEGRSVRTAIFKQPVTGPVPLGRLGLAGDTQADRKNHGGPDQAAYAYPEEHYAHWARWLGRPSLPFGQFGENLTTRGLTEAGVHVGDVFRTGGAEVQVAGVRTPCFKLGIRTGRPDLVRPFLESGLLGFYLRVLAEGPVAAGDPVTLVRADPSALRVADLIAALYHADPPRELLERAHDAPAVHPADRARLAGRLARAR